jgi:D-arabinose 1-dehydrogenase-like Zn-dependent alcohol dehydrogenase
MNDINGAGRSYLAVQAVAPGRLEVVRLPLVEPCFGTVRLRVQACGVCHTDTATVEGRFPGVEFPRVPGHEVVGTIDAIGLGVEGWFTGQRVGVGLLGGHCGSCEACQRGDFACCRLQPITGVHVEGGYAEVMIAHGNALVAIPDVLSSIDAAPLLGAGSTTFSGLRKAIAQPGDLVAIQGVGGLGHLAIQFARRMGFHTVAIGRGIEKGALAMELGAHHYIDSDTGDVATGLRKLGGARTILSTAPNGESTASLVEALEPGGELIVAGVEGDRRIAVDGLELMLGGRSIRGTFAGSPMDSADTLRFSVLQGVRPIVETVPLVDAPRAYRKVLNGDAGSRMVLVTGQ